MNEAELTIKLAAVTAERDRLAAWRLNLLNGDGIQARYNRELQEKLNIKSKECDELMAECQEQREEMDILARANGYLHAELFKLEQCE